MQQSAASRRTLRRRQPCTHAATSRGHRRPGHSSAATTSSAEASAHCHASRNPVRPRRQPKSGSTAKTTAAAALAGNVRRRPPPLPPRGRGRTRRRQPEFGPAATNRSFFSYPLKVGDISRLYRRHRCDRDVEISIFPMGRFAKKFCKSDDV